MSLPVPRTPIADSSGNVTRSWVLWFNSVSDFIAGQQTGSVQITPTSTDYASAVVAFPVSFDEPPKVFLNPTNFPHASNTPMSCYATDITSSGFTINLACASPTGGGGDTITQMVTVDWIATQ